MFTDSSSTTYLVYKVDGNADGSTPLIKAVPLVATSPLSISVVDSSSLSHATLLRNDLDWEGSCIEGPWLHAPPNSPYLYLYYSASMYDTVDYAVGVARSSSGVYGPWEKFGPPILHVGGEGSAFSGPGHCSVVGRDDDGRIFMIYHAHAGYSEPNINTKRVMMMEEVLLEGGWVQIKSGGVPSEGVQDITN